MELKPDNKLRNISRGCAPNPYNPEGWYQLSDEEKLKEEIACMNRHIHFMSECNDSLSELMKEE